MSSPSPPSLGSLLETAAPAVSLPEAEAIARDVFGLSAAVSPLSGERDSNFHLRVDGAAQFVLKFSHPSEDPQVTAFQTAALLHVAARDPALPVPRVHLTRDGAPDWLFARPGEAPRIVRVLSYLDGEPLHRAPASAAQRRNLGAVLARLARALQGFAHPAAHHELLWDIQHADRVRGLLDHIPDPQQRGLARRFLDNFEAHALPVLDQLRAQVIHNDLNPHNVLVSAEDPGRIAGIIDFGDMVHAPLVNDLAVAAAYHPAQADHPLAAMADLVAGYHDVLPLQEEECALLFDLIAARMVVSVAISGWRAARHPDNRDYILRNNRLAWIGLESLDQIPRAQAQDYFRHLCRKD
ncbi:phosphotransferase [Pararhodobacter sp. SW119]|uniref:phosphotransferase n=1 Tax=Pararhodobacter sp. SW119 TaxID=2780075 RepID=UPI001ADFCAD4|nr:phosphotransferase [Pararhodobacter sp. SW119]